MYKQDVPQYSRCGTGSLFYAKRLLRFTKKIVMSYTNFLTPLDV